MVNQATVNLCYAGIVGIYGYFCYSILNYSLDKKFSKIKTQILFFKYFPESIYKLSFLFYF